jgi:dolichol-phosphate mannosyltransferase
MGTSTFRLSIVVPAFNEAAGLNLFLSELNQVIRDYPDREIIVVDDGSTDSTMAVIKDAAANDPHLRYLSLTRNFGHQTALRAGLERATGDAVISMDADLQHPPQLIPAMVAEWANGAEVVNMLRDPEAGSWFKRKTSALFYQFINSISDYRVEPGTSDFRLLDNKVVEQISALPEHGVFLRGMIPWMGYRQTSIQYQPGERNAGEPKYDLTRMFRLALTGVTSTSFRPLHFTTVLGVVMSFFAMVYAVYALFIKLVMDTAISGWTSLLISVMLLGGVQLMMLGIIGEYLGRVLREVKGRPEYLVRESSDDK